MRKFFLNAEIFCNFRNLGLVTLAVVALTACGSGSSEVPVVVIPDTSADLGNYSTGCVKDGPYGITYKTTSGTLSDAGDGKRKAVVHYQVFGRSQTCSPDALQYDVTGTFLLTSLGQTKGIKGDIVHPIVGTATLAEAQLQEFKLSKGSFNGTLPGAGVKTKVGYMRQNGDLLFVSGLHEADGIGSYFSNSVMKKLP